MTGTTSQTTLAAQIPGFRSAVETVAGVRLHYRIGGDPAGPPVRA